MNNYYVTFKVTVSDSKYSYSGNTGEADVQVQVPQSFVLELEPGNLFHVALIAALENLEAAIVAKAEEEKAAKEEEK